MNQALAALAVFSLASAGIAQAPVQPNPNFVISPATIDNDLEVTGDRLKARSFDTRIAVDVSIGDAGPYRFLVDSGADRTVIGRGLADRLALPAARRVLLHGTAGSLMVETVTLDGLKVGSNDIDSIEAPALLEEHIGADGILGIDSLAGQRMMMDFDADYVVVQDARVPERSDPNSEEIVVTARRKHGQLIITEAYSGRTSLFAVLDSGANISLANTALRDKIFANRRPPVPKKISLLSVTGQQIEADLIVLPSLVLGGVRIENVPIAFADAPPFALFGLADQPAVLLGTDLLRSFKRVSLDFRNRRVRFTLRRGAPLALSENSVAARRSARKAG